MGYTTEFFGSVKVEPPLNEAEIDYLRRFAGSRRMKRNRGPYYAQPGDNYGQGTMPGSRKDDPELGDVIDYNAAPEGQPGLWCQWIPTEDGSAIEWDGGEKFYDAPQWMAYLIDHFLKADAVVQQRLAAGARPADLADERAFGEFTFDHVLNGTIEAQGEEPNDRWQLEVEANVVYVRHAQPTTFGGRTQV